MSSVGKQASAKMVAGVPHWTEQLQEFGNALWKELPNRNEEVLAALILVLAFGIVLGSL